MASTTSTNISSMSRPHSLIPSATKASSPSKKAPKESKSDKSLETTVEKLTQNRNKEISARSDVASVKNVDKVESKGTEKEPRVGEGKNGERSPEKPIERVSESETKDRNGKHAPNSGSSAPAIVNPSSGVEDVPPPAVDSSPDKSRLELGSAGAKSEGSSATEGGGGTDASGSVKKSPCTDRDKEETSGSSTVTTNGSNSSKSSEEVVEGGDK